MHRLTIFGAMRLKKELETLSKSSTQTELSKHRAAYSMYEFAFCTIGASVCVEYNIYATNSVYGTIDNGGALKSVHSGTTNARGISARILRNTLLELYYQNNK